jgi:hypothetical protein
MDLDRLSAVQYAEIQSSVSSLHGDRIVFLLSGLQRTIGISWNQRDHLAT